MKVNVEIKHRAEVLNEGHDAGLGTSAAKCSATNHCRGLTRVTTLSRRVSMHASRRGRRNSCGLGRFWINM